MPEELELEADDLEFAYYEDDEIDLEPMLREQLILEIPIAPVCNETCSAGGSVRSEDSPEEKNTIDPRWAALQRLKEESENK